MDITKNQIYLSSPFRLEFKHTQLVFSWPLVLSAHPCHFANDDSIVVVQLKKSARTKCITMEKNYDFFVRHLAQPLNPGLNALQKKAPCITKKVMDLVLFLIGGLNALLFYFVILEKVMDLVVYLLGRLNALLF